MGCMSSKQTRSYAEEDWNDEKPESVRRSRWERQAQEEDERNRKELRECYEKRQRNADWDLGNGFVLEADPNTKGAYKLPT